MNAYSAIKTIHILSATVLFGTGLGTAVHMWLAHLRGDVRAIAVTAKNVVLVDWLFTATAGVVQPVTGVLLIALAGYDPFAPWLVVAYGLYILAFVCWAPVVWLQIRVRDIAGEACANGGVLPAVYFRYMRSWFWLGWPAFISLLVVFYLMVAKAI